MTERRGYYDVALFFPSHVTLKRLNELIGVLDDNDIDIDYSTLEFADDGLCCDAKTYREDVIEYIETLADDVLLDWETMNEWDICDGDEDE